MYSALLFASLILPSADPAPAQVGGMPPVQCLASIDSKGKLTLTRVMSAGCDRGGDEIELKAEVKRPDKETVKAVVKAKVTKLQIVVVELPAEFVEAYTEDGKAIPAAKLAELLVKEKAVVASQDGKKVDAFHLQLYKEGTIVLVPPANLWTDNSYGGGYGPPPPPDDFGKKPLPPERFEEKPRPEPIKKPPVDDGNPKDR